MKGEDYDLPLLYWIPKLQCPYKKTVIMGAAKFSTKPLSKILTSIFSVVKTCAQKYHDTCFSRIGVNLKYVCDSIKTFDFSILYTSIPHTLLKSRIKELFYRCISKNEKQRYQHLVIGRDASVFVKSHSRSNNINRTRSFQC
jgi:hypothetical protein